MCDIWPNYIYFSFLFKIPPFLKLDCLLLNYVALVCHLLFIPQFPVLYNGVASYLPQYFVMIKCFNMTEGTRKAPSDSLHMGSIAVSRCRTGSTIYTRWLMSYTVLSLQSSTYFGAVQHHL